MKSKCLHKFEIVGTEIHGQRKVYHLSCSLCSAKRRRNRTLKRFQPTKGTGHRKQAKTTQKSRKCKIRTRSLKRQKQEADYSTLRKQFLEEYPVCQVCHFEDSNQVHHQRGKEGSWLTDTSEFLAVCWSCHDRIENNREWAKEQGYLKLRISSKVA